MTTKSTKASDAEEIIITRIDMQAIDLHIVGTSPLIQNQFNRKSWEQLLLPSKRSKATQEATLKHDPRAEFRASGYLMTDETAPTLFGILPTALKGAMRTAALDIPGAKKTQLGRLLNVAWDRTPLFGIPSLHMAMVRNSDLKHTPDVRTRVAFKQWACTLRIMYPSPTLRATSIVNIAHAAGRFAGVCEWRAEKGSGNFGSFRICEDASDPEFVHITKTMGRKAQQKAFDNPQAFDEDTAELLRWADAEIKRRGFKVAA